MFAPVHLDAVDLATPPTDLVAPDTYGRARVLLLVHGTPIGTVDVALDGGVCPAGRLRAAVLDCSDALVRHLLGDALERGADRSPASLAALLREPPPPPAPAVSVTVAVCTRDRPTDLERCLRALLASDPTPADLLVVDNASTSGATREIVERFGARVRYVYEPCPGLDWARNRAIVSTASDVLAFTDDDVVVGPGWVSSLVRVFAGSPEVMAVTGLVEPAELEAPAQAMFETYGGFGRGYRRRWVRATASATAVTVFGNAGTLGTGANMAFRTAVFERVGHFDPALDVGTPTRGAGDLDMFFRVGANGHTLVYEPAAYVRHRHRRDDGQLRRQIGEWGSGMAAYIAANRERFPDQRRGLTMLAARLLGLYAPRRLSESLTGGSVPPRLVVEEIRGALAGPRRYRESVGAARALASEFGYAPFGVPVHARRVSGSTQDVAIDLRAPLAPLPADGPGTLRLLVASGDARLGRLDVAHGEGGVSAARVRDEVVDRFGSVLLGDLSAHRAALAAALGIGGKA